MFDIGFSELLLVFVIGLVVLGPQRLPVAVKTVVGWIRALRSLASTVQNELAQELKIQELQDSLKKVEKASMDHLTPELKASMDELRQAAESMKRSYTQDPEQASDEAHTIHNPLVKDSQDSHEGVTPATAAHQASAPERTPEEESTPATESSGASAQEYLQPQGKPAPQPVSTSAPSQPSSDKK